VLGYPVAVPRSTPLRANPARNGDPGCAGLGCHRLKFVATAAGFVRRGTAGPSTPAEAVGRDDNSRESAGGARDDSDRGDVTAQLKPGAPGSPVGWANLGSLRARKDVMCRRLKPAQESIETPYPGLTSWANVSSALAGSVRRDSFC
jgi:hypothetical protein